MKSLAFFILLLPSAIYAQPGEPDRVPDSSLALNPRSASIKLLARTDRDSVVLRWAPSKPGGWITANKHGYVVERVEVDSKGHFDRKQYQKLTAAPLKPWTLQEWNDRFNTRPNPEKRFPAIAAQMLYGKSAFPAAKGPKDVNTLALQAEDFENRFGFALFSADNDPAAAEGLALRFVDRNVKSGGKYIYRVYTASIDPTYKLDTAYILVDILPAVMPPAPAELIVDSGDGRLRLHWHEPPFGGYSGYYVYRSEDGGKNFTQLNESPVIAIRSPRAKGPAEPQFMDTAVVNYRKYRYRVRGVTAFAELSQPAEIDAYGRDLTPPFPASPGNATQIGTRKIKLTWEMPKVSPDLSGFVIERSSNALTGFGPITTSQLTRSTRSFIDNAATPDEPYYMIDAIDTAGNISHSIAIAGEVIDSLPPAPPTGLTGVMDTNGIVRLHWHLGPEKNIIGYRVLWANDPKHEFSQRTGEAWKDTSFVDTVQVRSLTKYVYYRVAAVDNRKNHSEMSAIFGVKRPDLLPPEQSVFTNVIANDSTNELHWAHSRSEDLATQILMRRVYSQNLSPSQQAVWTEATRFGPTIENYIDRKVEQNTTYEYTLLAVDSSGNRSQPCPPVIARPFDRGVRPPVRALRALFDEKSKRVRLEWSYSPSRREKYWFVIYRATSDRSIAQYRAVKSESTQFVDDPMQPSGPYTYAVRVETQDGAQSPLSEKVSVVLK